MTTELENTVTPPSPPTQGSQDQPPLSRSNLRTSASSGSNGPAWPFVVALGVVVVLGLVVGQAAVGWFSPRLYAGTVLQSNDPAPSMDGLSFARSGTPVDPAGHDGEVVIVFFGYTNCPDVCPASMALAAQAVAGMSTDDQARTKLWMVTVDPERDVPDRLQPYVEQFNPTFDGVTGEPGDIERVSTEYGVFYQHDMTAGDLSAGGTADGYLVDHTASLFGIDPDGTLRVVWPPNVTAEELRADIEALLS